MQLHSTIANQLVTLYYKVVHGKTNCFLAEFCFNR